MNGQPRAFDLALLAPLGLAVVAYQLAEPGEIIPPVALIAAVLARALQDAQGWVLGKSSIAFAVAAAIVYVIVDVGRNEFQVTLFADFMMILAALKAMERRTPRDDGQLLVVSVFVALSAAVSSNRMGTGILLVLYLFTLMFAIMRMQVDAAMWPKAPERRGRLAPLLGGCIVGSTIVASLSFVL
ncbi:MAG: transglutaminaseTgpA domain-containing protein, partial [Planctomycetota bacterium]